MAYGKHDAISFRFTLLMIRAAIWLATLAVALLAVPTLAQDTPPSNAMFRKIPISISGLTPEPMNGEDCSSGAMANAALAAADPITGEKQAEPIIAIPLTVTSLSIAAATARAQEVYACEQGRKQ
jgi:hypothetical protein